MSYIPAGIAVSLQAAYAAGPTVPQILLDSVPNPLTVRAAVSGGIFALQDSGSVERLRVDDSGSALLALTLTDQGFLPPVMTEAERDLIGTPATGLVVYNTDDNQINSYNGSGWVIPGAGLTTLQGAYTNAPASAQILLDAVPNPLTVQASVAGLVFQVKDIAGSNIFQVTANPDTATLNGQLAITDAFLNSAAVHSLVMADTFTTGGGFNGGGITSSGTVTYNNGFFIWALLAELKVYRAAAAPTFAAFTLFNALPRIENSGNFDLVGALVLNVGVNHRRTTSGTSTTAIANGMNFAIQLSTTVSGAVVTRTNASAVQLAPVFSTVAGSTVNLGTMRGLNCLQPAVALFGSSAGVENMTAYNGVEFADMTFGGGLAVYNVIRSFLNAGTNKRFLNHTGSATSVMRGSLFFDVDNVGVFHGASNDVVTYWNGADAAYRMQFAAAVSSIKWSNPASGRFLVDSTMTPTVGSEINFNFGRFSFGDQLGPVGNQVGVWITPPRSTQVGGEWSDYLLTQASGLAVDHAMSGVYAWTVNAVTMVLGGGGSVTTSAVLNVGGNPNEGTNRVGLQILSNPTGGGGVNAALWITAGLARFDGRVDINQPIALGGGAAATLGTIGGTGPTAAAQAQWVEIDVNGVAHWIPAWT